VKPCPCGCARQLGWSDSRVANSAGMVLQRLTVHARVAELLEVRGSINAADSRSFLNQGVSYADRVLRVAHGDHSPFAQEDMPTLKEGTWWVREADRVAPRLPESDPAWCRWYTEQGGGSGIRVGGKGSGKFRGQSSDPPPVPLRDPEQ
jgi:hypothetical protein